MNRKQPLKDEIKAYIRTIRKRSSGDPLYLREHKPAPRKNPDADKDAFPDVRREYETHLDAMNAGCRFPAPEPDPLQKNLQDANRLAAPADEPDTSGLKSMLRRILRKIVRFAMQDEWERIVSFDGAVTRSLNDISGQLRAMRSHQEMLNSEFVQYGQSVVPVVDEKLERVYRETVDHLTERMDILFDGLDRRNTVISQWLHNVVARMDELDNTCRRGLALQHRKLEQMMADSRVEPRREHREGGQPSPVLSAFEYVMFESSHRGPEDAIRGSQEEYIPFFDGHVPVLDIGCGRGEFLELLKERGMPASGIDVNGDMVEICRGKGLDVRRMDSLAYLNACPADSIGGVFAAQVVEHLPRNALPAWLTGICRVLKPGGIFLFETVNTASPYALLTHYTKDPTHQPPLHPETYRYLAEIHGFADVSIDYIHRPPDMPGAWELPEDAAERNDRVMARIHGDLRKISDFIYAPSDILIRCRKPGGET